MATQKQIEELVKFIEEVHDFREKHKDCTSTSHTINFKLFCSLTDILASNFPNMTVEFEGYNKDIEIIIPRYKR